MRIGVPPETKTDGHRIATGAAEDPRLAKGVNVAAGRVTCAPFAEDLSEVLGGGPAGTAAR